MFHKHNISYKLFQSKVLIHIKCTLQNYNHKTSFKYRNHENNTILYKQIWEMPGKYSKKSINEFFCIKFALFKHHEKGHALSPRNICEH